MEFSDMITGMTKDRFRSAANRLLNECFILKQSKDTRADYMLILNQRQTFIDYFDLLGYEVIISEKDGVIALNNFCGIGRIHLRKIDSILLLILRLLYIEEKKKISESNEVIVVVDAIYEKYNMLKLGKCPDKTTMRTAMGLFKKYHLIDNMEKDMSDSNTHIKIWPSILFAVTMESIDSMYESAKDRLAKYAKGGDSDDARDFTEDEIVDANEVD